MKDNIYPIKSKNILYRVSKNEDINDISKKLNVDVNYIMQFNDIQSGVEEGDVLFLPNENMICHIVGPLDNLTSIASKYNCSVEHILKLNNIETLFIGQKIFI